MPVNESTMKSVKNAMEILSKDNTSSKEQVKEYIDGVKSDLDNTESIEDFKEKTIKKVTEFFEAFQGEIEKIADDDKQKEIKEQLINTIIYSKEQGIEGDILGSLQETIKIISSTLGQ